MPPSREEAWSLVEEWVQSDSLRKHLLGVETGMRAYARKWGEDEELYAVTGLLHDLDYERYPDLETGHPRKALELFREKGYPQELIDAVAGHATFLGVPRESRMAKTLYAVDELSAHVHVPAGLEEIGDRALVDDRYGRRAVDVTQGETLARAACIAAYGPEHDSREAYLPRMIRKLARAQRRRRPAREARVEQEDRERGSNRERDDETRRASPPAHAPSLAGAFRRLYSSGRGCGVRAGIL